ncbi:MAG: YtxH protein [Glaciihabitans sp.]|nr:YtxH protein [Glaciihabitans sp.]
MKGKILLVTGIGVGYVLGAKAGRERYESIKRITDKFWHSKGVQKQVHKVEDVVADKAPDVAKFIAKGAKKVVTRSSGTAKASTARPVPPSAPITPQI